MGKAGGEGVGDRNGGKGGGEGVGDRNEE